MKRIFGLILLGLGVALICIAPLSKFYMAPSLAVAPLDQYSVSTGVGVAIKQLDLVKFAAGAADPYYPANQPVTNVRYTVGDVTAAQQPPASTDGLAIYDTFSRTQTEDGRLISAGTSRYPFDRKTSALVNCCGGAEGGQTVNFTGLMPLKFPFFMNQQNYDVWDGTLLTSTTAVFTGVEDHAGLNTYKYTINVPPTVMPNSEQVVSAKLVGLPGDGDVTLNRYYSNTTTTWVEPTTGQILDSDSTVTQTLRGPDGTVDLFTVAQIQAGGDPAYVAQSAIDIQANASKLNLFLTTIPIISLVLGILLAIGGFMLARAGQAKNEDETGLGTPPPLPASYGTPPPPPTV